MYDPTFELSYREQRDEFIELLSMGHTPAEASAVLDTEYMDFGEWLEMYGSEEVDYQGNYSIQPMVNQQSILEIGV